MALAHALLQFGPDLTTCSVDGRISWLKGLSTRHVSKRVQEQPFALVYLAALRRLPRQLPRRKRASIEGLDVCRITVQNILTHEHRCRVSSQPEQARR